MAQEDERAGATAPASCAWPAAIDTSGFVFDPGGLTARAVGELAAGKQAGQAWPTRAAGGAPSPADALTVLRQHALANPILVDLTADDTTPLVLQAVEAGMDVVLANKRPLAGPRARQRELLAIAGAAADQRMLTEATVGAGLPIFDSYRKLVESGDRVLKIEGCLSGTLGFVLTEVERGTPFSEALAGAMEPATPSPTRATICRARTWAQGADPRAAARVRGRARRRRRRIAGAGGAARDPARRVRHAPRRAWTRTGRSGAAAAQGARARRCATSPPSARTRSPSACRPSAATSPFFGLKGTDNQVAFTTLRYRKTRW